MMIDRVLFGPFPRRLVLGIILLTLVCAPLTSLGIGHPAEVSAQAASLTGAWVHVDNAARKIRIEQTGADIILTITASPYADAVGRVYRGSLVGDEAVLSRPIENTAADIGTAIPPEVRQQLVARGQSVKSTLTRLADGRLRIVWTTFYVTWDSDSYAILKVEDNYGPVEHIFVRDPDPAPTP